MQVSLNQEASRAATAEANIGQSAQSVLIVAESDANQTNQKIDLNAAQKVVQNISDEVLRQFSTGMESAASIDDSLLSGVVRETSRAITAEFNESVRARTSEQNISDFEELLSDYLVQLKLDVATETSRAIAAEANISISNQVGENAISAAMVSEISRVLNRASMLSSAIFSTFQQARIFNYTFLAEISSLERLSPPIFSSLIQTLQTESELIQSEVSIASQALQSSAVETTSFESSTAFALRIYNESTSYFAKELRSLTANLSQAAEQLKESPLNAKASLAMQTAYFISSATERLVPDEASRALNAENTTFLQILSVANEILIQSLELSVATAASSAVTKEVSRAAWQEKMLSNKLYDVVLSAATAANLLMEEEIAYSAAISVLIDESASMMVQQNRFVQYTEASLAASGSGMFQTIYSQQSAIVRADLSAYKRGNKELTVAGSSAISDIAIQRSSSLYNEAMFSNAIAAIKTDTLSARIQEEASQNSAYFAYLTSMLATVPSNDNQVQSLLTFIQGIRSAATQSVTLDLNTESYRSLLIENLLSSSLFSAANAWQQQQSIDQTALFAEQSRAMTEESQTLALALSVEISRVMDQVEPSLHSELLAEESWASSGEYGLLDSFTNALEAEASQESSGEAFLEESLTLTINTINSSFINSLTKQEEAAAISKETSLSSYLSLVDSFLLQTEISLTNRVQEENDRLTQEYSGFIDWETSYNAALKVTNHTTSLQLKTEISFLQNQISTAEYQQLGIDSSIGSKLIADEYTLQAVVDQWASVAIKDQVSSSDSIQKQIFLERNFTALPVEASLQSAIDTIQRQQLAIEASISSYLAKEISTSIATEESRRKFAGQFLTQTLETESSQSTNAEKILVITLDNNTAVASMEAGSLKTELNASIVQLSDELIGQLRSETSRSFFSEISLTFTAQVTYNSALNSLHSFAVDAKYSAQALALQIETILAQITSSEASINSYAQVIHENIVTPLMHSLADELSGDFSIVETAQSSILSELTADILSEKSSEMYINETVNSAVTNNAQTSLNSETSRSLAIEYSMSAELDILKSSSILVQLSNSNFFSQLQAVEVSQTVYAASANFQSHSFEQSAIRSLLLEHSTALFNENQLNKTLFFNVAQQLAVLSNERSLALTSERILNGEISNINSSDILHLDAEIALVNRESSGLQLALQQETSSALSKEHSFAMVLDFLTTNMLSSQANLVYNLTGEASRAAVVDTNLSYLIDTQFSALQFGIVVETSQAQQIEKSTSISLLTEVSRAESSENSITNTLATLIAQESSAVAQLKDSILQEQSRANKVLHDAMLSLYSGESTLWSILLNLTTHTSELMANVMAANDGYLLNSIASLTASTADRSALNVNVDSQQFVNWTEFFTERPTVSSRLWAFTDSTKTYCSTCSTVSLRICLKTWTPAVPSQLINTSLWVNTYEYKIAQLRFRVSSFEALNISTHGYNETTVHTDNPIYRLVLHDVAGTGCLDVLAYLSKSSGQNASIGHSTSNTSITTIPLLDAINLSLASVPSYDILWQYTDSINGSMAFNPLQNAASSSLTSPTSSAASTSQGNTSSITNIQWVLVGWTIALTVVFAILLVLGGVKELQESRRSKLPSTNYLDVLFSDSDKKRLAQLYNRSPTLPNAFRNANALDFAVAQHREYRANSISLFGPTVSKETSTESPIVISHNPLYTTDGGTDLKPRDAVPRFSRDKYIPESVESEFV